jgi:hypothetical protein
MEMDSFDYRKTPPKTSPDGRFARHSLSYKDMYTKPEDKRA